MQPYATIVGVIRMRAQNMPYEVCEQSFNIGSGTVQRIMKREKEIGKSIDELTAMAPEEVEEAFYPLENRQHRKLPLPDFESMCERMEAKGSRLNILSLWWEYREANPENYYGYTQFAKYFREYIERTRGPEHLKMIVERIPGERMYIDWVGDQPPLLLDPKTGELRKVHIFCATVGVSSLGYAEVFADEKIPSFVAGTVHALEYFGAVPRFAVPDNMKTAVIRNSKDDLILTTACADLQDFYGMTFLPPPPRKPTGKGSVENFVRYLESHYMERLKKEALESPFTSIAAINERGIPICDELNTRLERGRIESRRTIFENIDLRHMRPLPPESFTVWDYVRYEKVPQTYHVKYDGHLYSVPYTYAGKPVTLRASISEIIITNQQNRQIAAHTRAYNEYPKSITNPNHLHPDHAYYAEVNKLDGQRYRDWASGIGPRTFKVMERLLLTTDHEEQMYAKCAAVIEDVKGAAPERIEDAAAWCLANGACTCTKFKKAVSDGLKVETVAPPEYASHANMRGKEYFS